METNEIAGIGHQLVGALKQTVGKLIGDAKLKSDGTTERVLGKARNGAGGQLVPGIDTDRITGFVHQSKGEAEQALGGLIGYAKLMTDGRAE